MNRVGMQRGFKMMLNSEDLSELLTRAENTQQMYEQDRKES